MKNFDIIFKNGKTVTENGVEDCDIAVADGKICEELMCGHCGRVGSRKSVSVELLKVFGLDPNEKYEDEDTEEESVEEKEENPQGIINKIKSKILKGVKGETD